MYSLVAQWLLQEAIAISHEDAEDDMAGGSGTEVSPGSKRPREEAAGGSAGAGTSSRTAAAGGDAPSLPPAQAAASGAGAAPVQESSEDAAAGRISPLSPSLLAEIDRLCEATSVPASPALTLAEGPAARSAAAGTAARALGIEAADIDALIRMRAAVQAAKSKVLPEFRFAAASSDTAGSAASGAAAPSAEALLADFPPGVSTGDPRLDALASVLRMVHVARLRDSQDRVNGLLEAGQEFTADPKTESRLGKVGR